MVNQWPGVPAKCLCDKHLNAVLSETTNLLLPSMRKGHKITNYIKHGCVDVTGIAPRVKECIEEARSRGHTWKYQPISKEDDMLIFSYSKDNVACDESERARMNRMVLAFRCPECRQRMRMLE